MKRLPEACEINSQRWFEMPILAGIEFAEKGKRLELDRTFFLAMAYNW